MSCSFYEILGVSSLADSKTIKKAYLVRLVPSLSKGIGGRVREDVTQDVSSDLQLISASIHSKLILLCVSAARTRQQPGQCQHQQLHVLR